MIELTNVNKVYRQGNQQYHVLKDISLKVTAGEFLAIVGPSGSGKSTLINIIGFLDNHFEGHYQFNKQEIGRLNQRQFASLRNQKVGFVFQNFKLITNLNVGENIALPLLYAGKRRDEINERIEAALDKVGLTGFSSKMPKNMSGGQQQRVAIARAIVANPNFLIADEPTGALDSHNSADIMQLFTDLNRELGTTIIMVTHDDHLAQMCDRIVKITDGRISSDKGMRSC
ncbi:ABC transporter, ATP-binding protein [Paucilactobacillus vaccinostercus DSM 20634]|uniref:ABC transporter, ATP-binding protein n=1 Tax=Paucilactobacillus vaccinostercus DSM 20634 TaxID=1423813 RepID=A0A0R2A3Q5_9LACO|nr:ABC transporter ATP-binding protein [Paucilactobacillus vaccinostercus]KRM61082.1 ABC transporter, ATP-binding protein [Paucilactobacillus vaccinostercus DSM 20634]